MLLPCVCIPFQELTLIESFAEWRERLFVPFLDRFLFTTPRKVSRRCRDPVPRNLFVFPASSVCLSSIPGTNILKHHCSFPPFLESFLFINASISVQKVTRPQDFFSVKQTSQAPCFLSVYIPSQPLTHISAGWRDYFLLFYRFLPVNRPADAKTQDLFSSMQPPTYFLLLRHTERFAGWRNYVLSLFISHVFSGALVFENHGLRQCEGGRAVSQVASLVLIHLPSRSSC